MTARLRANELPPADIAWAARRVSAWFAERGMVGWKLDGIEQRSEWISVEDQLPEALAKVLVFHGMHKDARAMSVGMRTEEGYWTSQRQQAVTHWLPLPEPPK